MPCQVRTAEPGLGRLRVAGVDCSAAVEELRSIFPLAHLTSQLAGCTYIYIIFSRDVSSLRSEGSALSLNGFVPILHNFVRLLKLPL
jgi:hypothetical protein